MTNTDNTRHSSDRTQAATVTSPVEMTVSERSAARGGSSGAQRLEHGNQAGSSHRQQPARSDRIRHERPCVRGRPHCRRRCPPAHRAASSGATLCSTVLAYLPPRPLRGSRPTTLKTCRGQVSAAADTGGQAPTEGVVVSRIIGHLAFLSRRGSFRHLVNGLWQLPRGNPAA
jgi:hypothetical protein